MSRKKRTVWLCVLAAVMVAAVIWLWPRNMRTMTGLKIEEISFWQISTEFPHPASDMPDVHRTQDSRLQELYEWQFSRPAYRTVFLSKAENWYEIGIAPDSEQTETKRAHITITSDGEFWDGTWRYQLVGSKKELQRLNEWLEELIVENGNESLT